jgi:CheY-like chemotaxis protein
VVDDVQANLLALEVLLEGLPCEVTLARSGLEALSLLLRDSFAVMLLDVRMPGMDGYEVARHARMHSGCRDLPVIFMTAESPTEEHLKLGYDAGAVDFLFKPVGKAAPTPRCSSSPRRRAAPA